MKLKNILEKLTQKISLSETELETALNEIVAENNLVQAGAFFALLHAKPETSDEIASLIKIFQKTMTPVITPRRVLDIVGTGGDGAHTVNISTGSAILAASCGIRIAKHGNRSVSSQCGASDVLEALGIQITLSPEKVARCIDVVNIGFCYAPNFHPTWAKFRAIRQQLGIQTIFNILGPLLNPAHAQHYLLGVYDEKLLPTIAEALQKAGVQKSLVVHGTGLDEISTLGKTSVVEISENKINSFSIDPEKLGFKRCALQDLRGGSAEHNTRLLLNVFSGEKNAIADTLILNAAAAIWIYGKTESLEDAIVLARKNLESGAALQTLQKWKEASHA